MDDPWGSPWADEAEVHHDEKKNTRDLDVRPTTPVRASTLALEEKTNPPWGDEEDDGFGNWAALPADDGDETGFDGTSDGWEGNTANRGKLEGTLLSPSELPWNGTPKILSPSLPSLSPSLMPKSTQLLRQPSPDPWATEFVPNDVLPSKPQSPKEDGKGGSGQIDNEELQEDTMHTFSTVDALGVELSTDSNNTVRNISSTEDHTAPQSSTQSIEASLHLETPEDIPDIEPVSSRPSSSPSEHSRHDENLQDSPRTSIEEDSARPPVPRQVSYEVQELFEHIDGLGEVEVCESTKSRNNSPGPQDDLNVSNEVGNLDQDLPADEAEDSEGKMDDFGDFEEGNSDAGELNDDSGPAVETPAFSPDVSTGPQDSDITRERATSLKENYGPVKFDIDVSALSTIYPDLDYKPAEEIVFIPDRDLDNTLSTTEQRKTWYRVSRYGTKRKHDTGDDDNYVRINWAHSEIRKDTLKIVARWMEEDRISGRVVLGGASKGSSVFGWSDSKVPPVPIAHVFAAKKGKTPDLPASESAPEVPREWPKRSAKTGSRSTSKTHLSPKARRHNSVKSVSLSEDIKPIPEAPVADFGWNAPATPIRDVPKPLSKTPPAKSPPTPKPISSSHPTSSPTRGSERTPNSILVASTTPAARPLSIVRTGIPILPSLVTDIKNDEDDWGEMVSSPAISATPVVPSANILLRSPSLGGNLSAGVVPPLAPGFQPQMSPLSQMHSPNSSFDKGVATNAQASNPTPATTADELSSIPTLASKGPGSIPVVKPINPSIPTGNPDPWGSADFSFFESPAPVPVSTAAPMAKPIPKITPNVTAPKTVSFSAPAPINTSKPAWKSKDEIEQDRIVQSVVKGLPDLSYMLRR